MIIRGYDIEMGYESPKSWPDKPMLWAGKDYYDGHWFVVHLWRLWLQIHWM